MAMVYFGVEYILMMSHSLLLQHCFRSDGPPALALPAHAYS